MRAVDIITKKRDGGELSREELAFFIEGFMRGDIPDYQVSAWAMAVYFQGMTEEETCNLTDIMVESGDRIDLSEVGPIAVDKHSTGGVGDKTTLVVEPIVASCGIPFGKMSGKGLSFTGGTLDKMESIEGFRIELSTEEFLNQLKSIGLVLSGQSVDLAPADGKLYALRDVTGSVPAVPLIASSVMSKKIASGAQGIVLDVKVGVGAFMPSVEKAEELARGMIAIGHNAGREVVALISDMNQPLGHAVGNALEVKEAIETLHGGGPPDFREHCLEVAGHLLMLAKKANNLRYSKRLAEEALNSGAAWAKFRALVQAQGGEVSQVDHPETLPKAEFIEVIPSAHSGYLERVHAREIGLAVVGLGGGRQKKGEPIDHAVGVIVHKKVGDVVADGESLFTVHAADQASLKCAIDRVANAHKISNSPADPLPLFYNTIRS